MKTFILLCLLVSVAFMRKHHQADPIYQCLTKTCNNQMQQCENTSLCKNDLNECMAIQLNNPFDYDEGIKCFQKDQHLSNLFTCIVQQCLGFHNHQ